MIDDYEYLREVDPKEYFNRLSKEYGIDVSKLMALEQDYDLTAKGKYAPLEDEVFPGNAAEAAGLPENYLLHLFQIDVVQYPPTYRDVDVLRLIRIVLEDYKGAKRSCRRLPGTLHQELSEPWQQWVYLRYLRNAIFYDTSGRMINPEDRIFIRSIARDVEYRYGVLNTPEVRKQIRKIRVVAGNDKRRSRDAEIPLNAVAAQRKVAWDGPD